jgi:hypothetical protein
MNNFFIILLFAVFLFACEETIDADLPQSEAPVVIDAWLYRKPETQVITITRANTYFDTGTPQGISGASVMVSDLSDPENPILFSETAAGRYVWNPRHAEDTFGIQGASYRLDVVIGERRYEAFSQMNRVPEIDSITWRLEPASAFMEESFFGEFWARDLEGEGDQYWIKAWKNGELLSKPSEINIAYDAGFSEDGNADGLIFIQPIRDGINPFDLDEDDMLIPPYELGDSVFVEINSITTEAFFFLEQAQIQTDRPGGFGELFATPLANVESNISSSDPNENVVGFFCTSDVNSLGRKFTEDAIFE